MELYGKMGDVLNFRIGVKREDVKWTDTLLYEFLCKYYGISDVLLETCNGMVLVKKYNVVGHREGDDYINVYESIGELDNLKWRVYLDSIYSVEVLE